MLRLVSRALLLVAGAGLVGLVVNAARPGGLAVLAWTPPTECTGAAHAAAPPVLMQPGEAAALCGRGDVVIADTRSAAAYAEGHVAGAVHVECSGDPANCDALGRFGAARLILVYGDGTDDAQTTAQCAGRRNPDTRIAVLAGGFRAWERAGLACASGPCAECATASTVSTAGPR